MTTIFKGTQGPWNMQPTAGNHDFSIYADDGRDLALVRNFDVGNANLIVKAPDLLALLDLLVNGEPSRRDYLEAAALVAEIKEHYGEQP